MIRKCQEGTFLDRQLSLFFTKEKKRRGCGHAVRKRRGAVKSQVHKNGQNMCSMKQVTVAKLGLKCTGISPHRRY